MSTRAHIGLLNNDGTVREVYSHFDNYLEGTGTILVNHYTTEDKVNKLLDLGDISSIGTEPVGTWLDDFGPRDFSKCYTYRERGEKDTDARTYSSVDDYLDHVDEDYTYLFKDGQWFYREWDDRELKPVADEL